jgi:hypothetical protein
MESPLGRAAKLTGKRVLVVEDELRDAGAEVVGPVPTVGGPILGPKEVPDAHRCPGRLGR